MALQKFSRRLLAITIGLVLSLLFAGALLKLLVHSPAPPPPDTPGLYLITGSSVMPYEHRPLWKGVIAGGTARINSLGFRGDEISPQPASGVRRLAVVGDSVVFGQRLREPQTLPAQLRHAVQDATGLPTEVINAGVRGYAARQYPAQVKKVLALKPGMVILVVTLVNDPELEQWKPESERLKEMKNSLWTKLPLARTFMIPAYTSEINRLFVNHVESLYAADSPEWKAFRNDMDQVKKITDNANVPLLVVIFPMMDRDLLFEEQTRQLEAALDESGIEWVNPEQDLRALSNEQMVVGNDDSHPSAETMNRTAKDILPSVLKRFAPLPGGTPPDLPAKPPPP